MKVASILSVCSLALATAVTANHGQSEHNSVTPVHIEAPANKPAHHWTTREAREHSFASAHTGDPAKKSTHHWEARKAHEPHRVHSRDADRHEYTHAEALATKPTHHWAARETREHEAAPHAGIKPSATRHHARDPDKPTERPSHTDFKDEKDEELRPARHWLRSMFKPTTKPEGSEAKHGHHFARDADHKQKDTHTDKPSHHFARDAREPKQDEDGKLGHHFARDADHKSKHTDSKSEDHHFARDAGAARPASKPEPVHTGGAIAGKPGHHFVRSVQHAHPGVGASGSGSGNPFAGTRFTPGSAISSVRGILTGGTGIKKTCDRCVAAMQVGQSLAQQSSAEDFSNAVVGLCQQVKYKSNGGCSSAFGPDKVGPYIQTLADANIQADGKSFCKAYFSAC